jgi:hypothetical protein
MADDVQILVEPFEETALPRKRLREIALASAAVTGVLGALNPDDVSVSDAEVLARKPDERSPFRATVFDRASNRAVELRGRLDAPEDLEVHPSDFAPHPGPEELRAAAEVLRADEGFAPLADRSDVVIFQPMPPLADVEHTDGTVTRRPTLGILDPQGSPRHRIVAVDVAAGTVDFHPAGVDPPTDADCEERLPAAGGPTRVRVRVIRNGEELWNLIVVRPRDSTPQTFKKGSGVELRSVHYKGRVVLFQAHVPILNVLYDDGTTFRDWQNQETPFQAKGNDPVGPGWRVCTEPPATIIEAGTDAGNFQGVAFWYADGELRIVSELQAAWYRYITDWRLRDDGVIKPRFGMAGTKNPRTCMRHQHHIYWRLDFDIDGAADEVVQQSRKFLPGRDRWTTLVREATRKRTPLTSWRVLDRTTKRGYRIVPGLADGTADAYGVSDLWFLRYHANELEDGVSAVTAPASETQTHISKFVNGESIDGTDVVVWYAGHFDHDEVHPSAGHGHIIGPELRPVNWT